MFTRIEKDIRRPINKRALFKTVGRVRGVAEDGYGQIEPERQAPPLWGLKSLEVTN